MFKLNKIRYFLLILIITPVFNACLSKVIIDEELSPAELIQRAQEATDRNQYKTAMQYYQILYDQNPNNIDLIITAEYEIAFIHYKQKDYRLAREKFSSVLNHYYTPDAELLPQQFKILSQIVLKRIDEKENGNLRK
jgi:outer membrane protein assembly factor BamD (BamD/ComL family)